jgi:hypothetical protein
MLDNWSNGVFEMLDNWSNGLFQMESEDYVKVSCSCGKFLYECLESWEAIILCRPNLMNLMHSHREQGHTISRVIGKYGSGSL